jgi:hypothetical protein
LNYLKGLPNLKELWLNLANNISKADADALQEAIPNLKIRR